MKVTFSNLSRVMPKAALHGRALKYLEPLNNAMAEFDINTPLRVAAFLSQIAVESGELQFVKELWGPTVQQQKYDPPSQLAMRLGNIQPGDGSRYRGRGLIQITGRGNYEVCGKALKLDLVADPKLLEQPETASRSAAWYWSWRRINIPADVGDIEQVTRLVNGGLTAIDDRRMYYARALQEFGL